MKVGANLSYDEMDLNEKEERFTTNSFKSSIESKMQGIVVGLGCDMKRALSTTGPGIRLHQDKYHEYDYLYCPEINKEAWILMLKNVGGKGLRVTGNTAKAWRSGSHTHLPKTTILCFADYLDVYKQIEDFGLVDLDLCARADQELLDRTGYILKTNQSDGLWAFRITLCMRNSKTHDAFLEQTNKLARLYKLSIVHFYKRNYAEPIKGTTYCGAPMLTAQWILRRQNG